MHMVVVGVYTIRKTLVFVSSSIVAVAVVGFILIYISPFRVRVCGASVGTCIVSQLCADMCQNITNHDARRPDNKASVVLLAVGAFAKKCQ